MQLHSLIYLAKAEKWNQCLGGKLTLLIFCKLSMKCIPSHVRAFHPECIRSNHPISAITTLPWHFKKMTWYAECKTVSWPCPFNLNEDSKLVMKKTFLLCTTVSLSHLRTMLPESSSRPLPSKRPNHATWSLFHSKSMYISGMLRQMRTKLRDWAY